MRTASTWNSIGEALRPVPPTLNDDDVDDDDDDELLASPHPFPVSPPPLPQTCARDCFAV